jgi:hypothetical protein
VRLNSTLDVSQPVFNVQTFSSFYEQRAIGVRWVLRIVGTMGSRLTPANRALRRGRVLRDAPDARWATHGDRCQVGCADSAARDWCSR